jgi:hypothetical protein
VRQFITLRFWMSLLAVVALFGLVYVATRGEPHSDQVIAAADEGPVQRHVDFVSQVYSINGDPGFAMVRGKANGELQLIIDGSRTMVVQPDTPGEISCTDLAAVGQCVVVADLLGDAVLWFALVPFEQARSVTMPGIAKLDDQNMVELTNGWLVRRAASVDLDCADDVSSLTEFVRRFGPSSTTSFSLDDQQIVKSACTQAPESTTTSVVPATPPPQDGVPGETVPPEEAPDASNSGIG